MCAAPAREPLAQNLASPRERIGFATFPPIKTSKEFYDAGENVQTWPSIWMEEMPVRRPKPVSVPYVGATSGQKAREEISKILRRLGCESIGFMDDFATAEVLLAFSHRGRPVQLRASAKGWAAMYLRAKPWNAYYRCSRQEHEQTALKQSHVAVNSILRDWIKGQVTAIECGILSFEGVFMPYMLTNDGRPLLERAVELLPRPDNKVVTIGR